MNRRNFMKQAGMGLAAIAGVGALVKGEPIDEMHKCTQCNPRCPSNDAVEVEKQEPIIPSKEEVAKAIRYEREHGRNPWRRDTVTLTEVHDFKQKKVSTYNKGKLLAERYSG